jgi:hypothetical protein
MSSLLLPPLFQATDSNGAVLSGAKLFVYDAGTTTDADVYTDTALSVAHPQPVVADSAGRFANIYAPSGQNYKIVLKTSADVTVSTIDDIPPYVVNGSGALAITGGGTGATSAAAALTALGAAAASDVSTLTTTVTTATTEQADSVWETGTATTATVIAPDALAAAILAQNDLRPGMADAVVYDSKAVSTVGGTSSAGSWETRDLNAEKDPDGYVSISSNQVTFTVDGFVVYEVVANQCDGFTGRLQNITDGGNAEENVCGSGRAPSGTVVNCRVRGSAKVTAGKAYEIQMNSETNRSNDGFGEASGVGAEEVYCMLWFYRERKNT